MSGSDIPIATIVPVGIDAVVGDVVVASAVITSKINDILRLETQRMPKLAGTGSDDDVLIDLIHVEHGPLVKLKMRRDSVRATFVYEHAEGASVTPDHLLGDKFKAFAELAEHSTVVGFCPRSESDALDRTRRSLTTLGKIVTSKYPEAVIYKSLPPETSGGTFDSLWGAAVHAFPRVAVPITEEAMQVLSPSAVLRVLTATVVAEAIATGVRAARTLDLDDIHPALRLSSNWGYGTAEMLRALQVSTRFSTKGLRGQLMEHWIRWAEKAYSIGPSSSKSSEPLSDKEVVRMMGKFKVYLDEKDREAIPFDRDVAAKMSAELDTMLSTITVKWVSKYVTDMTEKLSKGHALNGRQMFKLVELHMRHVR